MKLARRMFLVLPLMMCCLFLSGCNEKIVKLQHSDKSMNEAKADIEVCTQEGLDAAKSANGAYVEHGGCWCKLKECDLSALCKGIADNKKNECLIDKGWTSK